MSQIRRILGTAAFVAAILAGSEALAFFHTWTFTEFFSNSSGTVQFIELQAGFPSETLSGGAQIRTTSGSHTFSFPSSLSAPTNHLLIATADFGSLPGGITPDYTIPTNFFDPAGDTIRLFHPSLGEFAPRTFASVPTDGVNSLNYAPVSGTGTNSPTNFAGTSGSVKPPTGDYNGNHTVDAADYVLWRKTLAQAVSPAGIGVDGNASLTIDAGDYDFWKARFGNPAPAAASGTVSSTVPEPLAGVLMSAGLALLAFRRRR